ncbi:hypothetical protein BJX99DRAFT_234125 [Aspergillus californicus]
MIATSVLHQYRLVQFSLPLGNPPKYLRQRSSSSESTSWILRRYSDHSLFAWALRTIAFLNTFCTPLLALFGLKTHEALLLAPGLD